MWINCLSNNKLNSWKHSLDLKHLTSTRYESYRSTKRNFFYKVLNSMGQQVFFAAEKNDCCTRQCCGPLREFEMALTGKRVVFMMNSPPWNIVNVLLFILDNNGREVARFNRPFKTTCRCCTCYCPCCLQEMEITASGTTVGYILQKQDFCNPVFQICDSDKKVVLEIKGPVCAISCCGDINFEVLFSCHEYNFLTLLPRFWRMMALKLEKSQNNGQD